MFTAAPKAVGQLPLGLRSLRVDGHGLDATWEMPLARVTRGPRIPSAARELLVLFLPKLFAGLDTVEEIPGSTDEHVILHVDHRLTLSEARVAIHIADGLTTRETATELGIAYQTVRTHLRNIYESLEVSSQRELSDFIVRWRDPR